MISENTDLPIADEENETAYEEGIADTNNSTFEEDIKHSIDEQSVLNDDEDESDSEESD